MQEFFSSAFGVALATAVTVIIISILLSEINTKKYKKGDRFMIYLFYTLPAMVTAALSSVMIADSLGGALSTFLVYSGCGIGMCLLVRSLMLMGAFNHPKFTR